MDKVIAHATHNPITSRGRTSISRMAACITDGVIRQLGWNTYKTHPLMYRFSKDHTKICLHAEIDALVRLSARYGLTDLQDFGFDVYVARVLKDGTTALAKPCGTCMGALVGLGINYNHIYWTK